MDARGEKFLADIIRSGSLPSLSALAIKLISLAAQEDSQPKDMARIIEVDPALSTRLLSLVNSAMYRRAEAPVTNITRAIMLLGVREVRIMALGLSLRDTIPTNKGDGFDYQLFWRLNVLRAIMAQRISQVLHLSNPEEIFIGALLVDIGLPLMLRSMPAVQCVEYPGFDVTREERLAWEMRELGINHRQIGVAVIKHWNLPPLFASCMLYPFGHSDDIVPKIVDFADFAAESCFLPRWSFTQIHLRGRKELGLNSEEINKVVADSLEVGGQLAQALQVDMDAEQDSLAVMEKANEALTRLSSEVAPKLKKVVEKASLLDNRRLQEKTISDTLEAVMHEIRNPLMSVGGFARRLATQNMASDNTQRYAQVILDEAGRLDQVLNKVSMLLAPVNASFLSVNLIELLEQTQGSAGDLQIKWQIPPGTLWFNTDGPLLQEAIVLLLHYAGYNDSPLEVSLAKQGKAVEIIVKGQGRLPGGKEMMMDELAFGPELNLVRIRRIMEGLDGEFHSQSDDYGFTLCFHLPIDN